MTQSKKLLMFGILIAGIIGLVAVSPTIYAIVEPHITINMEPGQTTNPFQINDNLGSEVFTIDSNGVITSSGGPIQLVYEADGPIDILTEFPNTVFIAKWKITKPAGALDANEIPFLENAKFSEFRRTSGTDFIEIGLYHSPDDITYSFRDGIGSISDTNEAVFDGSGDFFSIDGATKFIALGTDAGAGTTGEAKNIKIYYEIVLPHGWTIERVL